MAGNKNNGGGNDGKQPPGKDPRQQTFLNQLKFVPPEEGDMDEDDELLELDDVQRSFADILGNPDLAQDLFEGITAWHAEFVSSFGREPTEEEFADYVMGDWEDEEWEEDIFDDEDFEEGGAFDDALLSVGSDDDDWEPQPFDVTGQARGMDGWGLADEISPEDATCFCARCGKPVEEAVVFGGRMQILPFRREDEAAVFFVPLAIEQRLVPGIVVSSNAPAKIEGDIFFTFCSQACAQETHEALIHDSASGIRDSEL